MKVILLKELKGKGGEGDVIDVARGFANNYLLRQGYAVLATPGNLKQLEQRRHHIAQREEVRLADAEALAAKLDDVTLKIVAQVGGEGQLFGSVTTQMIADAAMEQAGIELDKKRIELKQPIKTAGEHEVAVSIYREIKGTLKLIVGSEASFAVEEAVEEAAEAVEAEAETEVDAEVAKLAEVAEELAAVNEAIETLEDVVEELAEVIEDAE